MVVLWLLGFCFNFWCCVFSGVVIGCFVGFGWFVRVLLLKFGLGFGFLRVWWFLMNSWCFGFVNGCLIDWLCWLLGCWLLSLDGFVWYWVWCGWCLLWLGWYLCWWLWWWCWWLCLFWSLWWWSCCCWGMFCWCWWCWWWLNWFGWWLCCWLCWWLWSWIL